MRISLALIPALVLTGCVSDYVTRYKLTTGCEELPYWVDSDGDGWGDAATDPVIQCAADVQDGTDARNDLDCDDSDGDITGEVGTVCPDELVGTNDEYVGVPISGGLEVVAVLGATDLRWDGAAVGACGPYGWGGVNLTPDDTSDDGRIATFNSSADYNAVLALLDANVDNYAGWVGLVKNDQFADGWGWEDSAALDPAEVGFCGGDPPSDLERGDLAHLALVKSATTGRWCFGLPSAATGGSTSYDDRNAHFICLRTEPSPGNYEKWIDSGDGG